MTNVTILRNEIEFIKEVSVYLDDQILRAGIELEHDVHKEFTKASRVLTNELMKIASWKFNILNVSRSQKNNLLNEKKLKELLDDDNMSKMFRKYVERTKNIITEILNE